MLVIGLIGMPGAGKGECARVAAELGYTVVSMGDIVRAHVRSLGLTMTDETIGGTAHEEREKHGYAIWAKRTVERINGLELDLAAGTLVVIDGIRGDAEVSVFKNAFGDEFRTVFVKMPDKMRFELLKKRKRSDAPLSWEQFKARDSRETGWGIQQAIADADYVIVNDGTLAELHDNFTELLKMLTGTGNETGKGIDNGTALDQGGAEDGC